MGNDSKHSNYTLNNASDKLVSMKTVNIAKSKKGAWEILEKQEVKGGGSITSDYLKEIIKEGDENRENRKHIGKGVEWINQTLNQDQLPIAAQSKNAIIGSDETSGKKEAEKSDDTGTVNIYRIEKMLLKKGYFIRDQECHLYYRVGNIYVMAGGYRWDEFVKRILPEDIIRKIREPGFYKKLLSDMCSNPDIRKINRDKVSLETKHLIAFRNGVYDIRTGAFRTEVSPENIIFTRLNANYKERPNVTEFENFICDVAGNDEDIRTQIWQMTSYIGIANTDGKVFFMLGPAPNSGKSVLLRLYEALIEPEETNRLGLHSMKGSFAFASLSNKRINISPECVEGKIREEVVANIKLLTGESSVNVERKGENPIKEKLYCKLFFATNSDIVLESMDEAFFNRMIIVPFLYTVEKSRWDLNLDEKLLKEKDDIISYAVQNYAYYLMKSNYQFAEPKAARHLRERWTSNNQNATERFLEECCMITNREEDFVASAELYESYAEWMRENYPEMPLKTDRAFTREVRARHISCSAGAVKGKVGREFVRVVRGIRMKGV